MNLSKLPAIYLTKPRDIDLATKHRTKAPPKIHKLSARAAVGYLIGYDGANKFRIWSPSLNIIVVTRGVTFDENTIYDPKDAIQDSNLIIENETLEAIDEFSINNSTRHPHQLADTIEDTINWRSIYDSPSIYSIIGNDNESEKADKIFQTDKSILLEDDNPQNRHAEVYCTPQSFQKYSDVNREINYDNSSHTNDTLRDDSSHSLLSSVTPTA
ncbi:hypothetical protein GcM3_040027, partial [Golovinomyces cichoracearum]